MVDATTPNFGYTLPTTGLDRDVWGELTNDNWSQLDTDLKAVSDAAGGGSSALTALINNIKAHIEPIGSIKPWPAPTPPTGWLACDGIAISRSSYPGLFAVIGTIWGAGDGSTTFNLPNFLGRTLVHRDNTQFGVSTLYGEGTHTLSVAEMPYHAHAASTDAQGLHHHAVTSPDTINTNFGVQIAVQANFGTNFIGEHTDDQGLHAHNVSVAASGGSAPHNNYQPSAGLLIIIKALNQF